MNDIRRFRRALRSAVGQQMAYQIRDGFGAALAPFFERVIRGERVPDGEILETLSGGATAEQYAAPAIFPASGRGGKATALVSVRGVALYDLEFQPIAFSTLKLSQDIKALANDPEIGTIVLDIDSPGGVVTGVPEAADAVFEARQSKRVVTLVNPLTASAAYWIGSQATEIVAVPSGEVGSIGVFMLHADCSAMMETAGIKPTFIFAGKNKVEGNAFEPLGTDALAFFQSEVDQTYQDFRKAVARGRDVTVFDVEQNFGRGRTFMAPVAKQAGMIDRIQTIDVAMSRVGVATGAEARRRSADINGEAEEDELGGEVIPSHIAEKVDALFSRAGACKAFLDKQTFENDEAAEAEAPDANEDEPRTPSRRRRLALLRHA